MKFYVSVAWNEKNSEFVLINDGFVRLHPKEYQVII